MALPINIKDLLEHKVVERARIDYKKGWNPEDVIHSMCAFANDIHNWGGGYIIIGVEEKDGMPILPPIGIKKNQIDKIQKEVLNISNRIIPNCHVIIDITSFMDKNIMIIWVPTGQERPYKAPKSLSDKNKGYHYYIRKGSSTCIAKRDEEKELSEISPRVPFDDRINYQQEIKDVDMKLIEKYLTEINSNLAENITNNDKIEILTRMNLIGGPPENLKPKNVALMFFNEYPDKIFPKTQIDVVYFPEGEGGDSFDEKVFTGPIHKIIESSLEYINTNFLREKVIKQEGKPESIRVWNYPYAALEEAIANAIYHRSYEIREPVEIRIYKEKIIILNRPGPNRSISNRDIKAFKFISRVYRNNRIGDFLKDLHLTEGRGTGIPKILLKLKQNGSPLPVITTSKERDYFMLEIKINPYFVEKESGESNQLSAKNVQEWHQVGTKLALSSKHEKIIVNCKKPIALVKLMDVLERKDRTKFRNTILKPLLKEDLIRMTIPDKPKSSKQKYIITEKGRKYLEENKIK